MHIGALIQARMQSKKFAGRPLCELDGRPALLYEIERVRQAKRIDRIILATTELPEDAPLIKFCHRWGVAHGRGDAWNVAQRLLDLCTQFEFDAFVRLEGDCPLIDYRLIDAAVAMLVEHDYDVVTNRSPVSWPTGQTVEVIRADAYRELVQQIKRPIYRRDPFRQVYDSPNGFRVGVLRHEPDWSDYQLGLKTQDDVVGLNRLLAGLPGPHWAHDVATLVQRVDSLKIKRRHSATLAEIPAIAAARPVGPPHPHRRRRAGAPERN